MPPNLTVSPTTSIGRSYSKETLVNGQPAKIRCIDIDGQTYVNIHTTMFAGGCER